MTLLLASISGPDEAESAAAHGADIIDLRGEATPETVHETLAAVAGRRAVSAGSALSGLQALADAGVDYLKVLARGDEDVIRSASPLAKRTRLLGIMLTEDGVDRSSIRLMAENGFAGVILNTTGGANLLDAIELPALAEFADAARAQGLMVGFAGALEPPDVPRLMLLEPDILAFKYDAATIEGLRAQIPPDQRKRTRTPAKVDYRLARAAEPDTRKLGLDRIFVRDFVLPMHIGTYTRERGETQNVRFSVEVSIARPSDVPQGMHDVLSYDVITDSIRMIAARGHVSLVETLAEQIAAAVLSHPRAIAVTVKVEKLDTGPGSVGVEIARERPAEAAKVRPLFQTGAESDPKASS